MPLDILKVRKDFPILKTKTIYLDNASTSLTPEPVVQKMIEYYNKYRSNTGRGIYQLSQKASEEYEKARSKIADFINTKFDSEIIITKNATEGINTIANGLKWKKGDKIVTTLLEHHSNFITWLRVKEKFNVTVKVIQPKDKTGVIDLADVEKAIDDATRLVAVTHVSNVLGTILPIKEFAQIVHEHGALLLVDGAQSVPHLDIDVRKMDCDFLVFSGHKMCGPTASGVLYIKNDFLDKVEPLCVGGGAISDVGIDYYKFEKSPLKFEAGTPLIAEAIGLGAAVDYLKNIGMENIKAHEKKLTEKIYTALTNIPNIRVFGPDPKLKIGITSFNIGNLNPHDVALTLDASANIAIRSGHHCALPLMKEVLKEPSGTARLSTYLYNTDEEIEKFVSIVSEIATSLV
jgi:cysteine desulfurase/selenocysteine lyase